MVCDIYYDDNTVIVENQARLVVEHWLLDT